MDQTIKPLNMPPQLKALAALGARDVYDEKASKAILDIIRKNPNDVAQGIAVAASTILEQMKKQVAGKMPPEAVYAAHGLVVGFILDLAIMAGLTKLDKEVYAKALAIVAMKIKEQAGPEVPPETQAEPQPELAGPPQTGLIGSAMGA